MKKLCLAPFLCLLLLAAACSVSAAPPVDRERASSPASLQPEASTQEQEQQPFARFDNDRAMAHVRALASRIGVRRRATAGERAAARYVAAELRSLGYEVKIQRFDVDSGSSRNVVARPPTAIRYPVVIGAHIDTVARSPGANDNASGAAVLLELARLVAAQPQARFVKLVAFGSEEYGTDGRHHVGSQVFVNRLSPRAKRRLAGMVSVDMVADGRPLIVGTAGIGPTVVARTLRRVIERAGIAVTYRTTCDCSDNGPFERAGIPAAFAWSGPEPNYHDPSDTVANLKPRHLLRTGRAMRVFVKALDGEMIRRFRQS